MQRLSQTSSRSYKHFLLMYQPAQIPAQQQPWGTWGTLLLPRQQQHGRQSPQLQQQPPAGTPHAFMKFSPSQPAAAGHAHLPCSSCQEQVPEALRQQANWQVSTKLEMQHPAAVYDGQCL